MDEPADFYGLPSAGSLTISGTNAANLAGWYVYERSDGHTIIAPSTHAAQTLKPPRHLGWEGHGARTFDGIEPEAHVAQAIKLLADQDRRRTQGAEMGKAIAALLRNGTGDGRPERFIPRLTEDCA